VSQNSFLSVLCLALAGCNCSGAPTILVNPTCTSLADIALGPPQQSDPVYRRGQHIDALFIWWPGVQCKEDLPDIKTVTLEVSAPDGTQVTSATATPPEYLANGYGYKSWQTTVSFDAAMEGPYHVLLTFDPGGGLLQKDLWVVQDATAELPALTDTARENCVHLERGSRGLISCTDGQTFQLGRDGGELQSGYGQVHLANDVAWSRNDRGVVSRSVDMGSGPLQLSVAWFGLEDNSAFAVRDEEILLYAVDRLALMHTSDGGMLVRDAELMAGGLRPAAIAYSRDAGTVVMAGEYGWSRFELAPGLTTPSPVWNGGERAIFQSRDGIWVTVDNITLRWVPADRTRPTVPITAPPGWLLPLGGQVTSSGHWPLFVPVSADGGFGTPLPTGTAWADATQALVPVFSGDTLQLRHYRAPEGAAFVEVTGGALRAAKGTQQFFWPLP
jgi:hypothetical protein